MTGPGQKHAATVATAMLGVAASIRIVELPDLPVKGDITNWRDAGGTLDQLRKLVAATDTLDATSLSAVADALGHHRRRPKAPAGAGRSGGRLAQTRTDPKRASAVEAFSEEILPDLFRPWCGTSPRECRSRWTYPAVVTVLCLAGAVNRRATIQPKANDTGWVVVPNFWGGIIAPPGFMKSPVIQAATRPLNQIQSEWRREHEEELEEYAREKEEYDLRCAAWKEQFKANTKKGRLRPRGRRISRRNRRYGA